MSDLVRFTVSIEKGLFDQLEEQVERYEYQNRSEFIRDLIRNQVVDQEWETDAELLGTISLVYDHHARNLSERLIEHQHSFVGSVMATTHVHLDEHLCAEMIMVRGKGHDIKTLANQLGREKGVLHAKLAVGTTGALLKHGAGNEHGHGHDHHGHVH